VNWRYAVGEMLLIAVGIFIALQASEWQIRKSERLTELSYLDELRTSLDLDRQRLLSGRERYRDIERRVEELIQLLQSDAPYSQSMDTNFGAVYGAGAFDLNAAAYESLKSHGLTLISNRDLRSQIAQVYEQTYADVRRSIRYEESSVFDLLRPYFLRNFKDLVFDKSATPLDYSEISNSPEFRNLVDYRLQLIKQNQVPTFERSADAIAQLIDAIDAELE
jgi:hypothetical protein